VFTIFVFQGIASESSRSPRSKNSEAWYGLR
jgi:hypothetical protein